MKIEEMTSKPFLTANYLWMDFKYEMISPVTIVKLCYLRMREKRE